MSDTTWTPPAVTGGTVDSIDVVVVGAGGGGGGGGGTYFLTGTQTAGAPGTPLLSGGGGGGGEVVQKALSITGNLTIDVGAGGAGGDSPTSGTALNGSDGAATTIVDGVTTLATAQGGMGGKSGTNGGHGGAAGGTVSAGGGVGLPNLQGNPQYSAGGGGGGGGGAGLDASLVSVNYGSFAPQQDMKAGRSGSRYLFAPDTSLWSSANFASSNSRPEKFGNYQLGLGGGGGNAIVGVASACQDLASKQQGDNGPATAGQGACYPAVTVGGNNYGVSLSVTATSVSFSDWAQAYAGAGGNGSVGNRFLGGTFPGSAGGSGAVLIRFFATKANVPADSAPVFIDKTPTATGIVGTTYSNYPFFASGNRMSYSLDSGNLPPGLSIAADGTLSGTPTTAGSYTFTVKAMNSAGSVVSPSITITITSTPSPEPTPDPTPTPSPSPTPDPSPSPAPTPSTKQTQSPLNPLDLPKSIAPNKWVTVIKAPIKTNAGLTAKTRVRCSPDRPRFAPQGDVVTCQTKRAKNGRVSVRVLGTPTRVTLTLFSPGTENFLAYRYKKLYRVR